MQLLNEVRSRQLVGDYIVVHEVVLFMLVKHLPLEFGVECGVVRVGCGVEYVMVRPVSLDDELAIDDHVHFEWSNCIIPRLLPASN